jgi:hypothetical protein
MELPVEVEIELSPAGSLKQAPLWKELKQLLENPYAPVVRRPGFGVPMPPLDVYPLDYNFLTGDTLRLRTSDGETAWDVPGPLFDPNEPVAVDEFNTPFNDPATPGGDRRTPIGALVSSDDANLDASDFDNVGGGYLIVSNPDDNPLIPPNGTVVAVPAVVGGVLQELDGTSTTATVDIPGGLEIPVNEENFFRPTTDVAGVPGPLRAYIGRPAAEVLGKALFWDMQVGSDSVQSCGSCHFHAGVDNRSKGQLNTGFNANDLTELNVHLNAGRPNLGNQEVVASDFPFHKRLDPETPGEGTDPAILFEDANDVMSSMGVSRFTLFTDIRPIGNASFAPAFMGVRTLLPDLGTVVDDPVPANQGFRRIEPRNTPTFHGAAFNNDNFWDGRARMALNGGSVQGAADPQFHIWVNNGTAGGAMHGLPDPEDPELPLAEWGPAPGEEPVPARIKFSSLGSQSLGPPLSDFEMSFAGRNWAKIGKKLLQGDSAGIGTVGALEVKPLANQLVDPNDSVLGPFSRQRPAIGAAPNAGSLGRPGLLISYGDLVRLGFARELWANNNQHFNGAPDATDPFDGFSLTLANGAVQAANTSQFRQIEANFTLFFSLGVQAYESLTIPDHTPADQFFDANPLAGHAVGEPGDQAVLFPTLIPDLMDDGLLNNSGGAYITLIPPTSQHAGFGADEVFGFDIFAGANLTAALDPAQSVGLSGRDRNPPHTITRYDGTPVTIRVGSNPFTRSAKCMLCHLGPEQTDASINIDHGLLKNDAEFEFPTPPQVPDPNRIFAPNVAGPYAGISTLPSPEPSGSSKTVPGLILSEEIEGSPQDAVEVEPRNMAVLDDPATPWDDRIISQPSNFAFGDQGMYNIGLRPVSALGEFEDLGRGANDAFGWPLANAALSLKNIGGPDFEPNDDPSENNVMAGVDPNDYELTFEESGGGFDFPGAPGYTVQSINPGFEKDPIIPLMPEYMVPWISGLSAGELHPQVDEIGGMYPNTTTPPNGGPGIEFPEVAFGADFHCARFDPAIFGAGPPSFGWGPFDGTDDVCPNNHSGVSGNFAFDIQGTWPVPNRVLRNGAMKAPALRNVELSGPYFHTGSYLTLRQVVDFYFRGGDFPVSNAENRDPHVVDLDEHAFSFGRTTGRPITIDGIVYPDDLGFPINYPLDAPIISVPSAPYIAGPIGFRDGLPDTVFLYDEYPDSDHPVTPEPVFASRAEAIEDAKNSIVKFLLALTDPRVKYEQAPFDRPQLFVPVDGRAPENTGGPAYLTLLANFSATNPGPFPGPDGVFFTPDDIAPNNAGADGLFGTADDLAADPGPDGLFGTADDVIVAGITAPLFRNILAVGAAGNLAGPDGIPGTADDTPTPLPNFLGVSSTPSAGPDHFDPVTDPGIPAPVAAAAGGSLRTQAGIKPLQQVSVRPTSRVVAQ